MSSGEFQALYDKYVPRWFKVIKWRQWAERAIVRQKIYIMVAYIPALALFYSRDDPYPFFLAIYKPQTEEERLALKRDKNSNFFQKNWKIDQYNDDNPPVYDVFMRRRKYPEHYGDKYNTFKMDNVSA